MAELQGFGRGLIVIGVLLVGFGLLLVAAPKVPWLGRWPGDLLIQRPGFTLYVPLASCLLASLLLSLAWWLVGRLR